MQKLLIILLSALSLTAVAQQPNWYSDSDRDANYPKWQYFTSFAEGQRQSGESIEAAISRMKNAARVEAVSTIRVHVQNTTINQALSQTLRTMEGTFRQSAREFSSATKTTVDMEIPGLQVESWRNPQTGDIAAFAYIKKSTLIRQLEKKITVALTKIETSLDQIDQLIATGQKMQARELAERTVPQFVEVDEAQKLLAAVDENADEESLQLQETRTLQHRLTGIIAQLKNGINICLICRADMFGQGYNALKGEIQRELSPMGCNFVTEGGNPDWTITVTAKAREYNKNDFGGVSTYYAYVDANIIVEKTTTGQRIYEDAISEKGGHTHNYEQAARQAYKDISPRISKIIKEQIQQ
ncbi:MAG: hypothetical protein IJ814_07815 [Paludibacteraceae bacterium]|nr:hypothetical protein [Paludibacteraceae bacterium]